MEFIITPTYSDIFDDEIPKLTDLLKDIPSNVTLSMLCLINAELFLGKRATQRKLFDLISRRFDSVLRNRILDRLSKYETEQRVDIFSIRYSLEFIHYELINYRDFSIVDTTPEQELNFFKAYLVITSTINKRYEHSFNSNDDNGEFFQVKTWPTFIDQYEVNHHIRPMHNLIRSLVFFNVLKKHPEFDGYVDAFTRYNQKESYWHYIMTITNTLQASWSKDISDKDSTPFVIKKGDITERILENFTLKLDEYQKEYVKDKKNFNGLKQSPLIEIQPNKFFVFNWNFIINKTYEGLVFDFYASSGIADNPKFKNFPDFKNFLGQEVTEDHIFKKVLSHYLNKKHSILKFDDYKNDGFPDAYYRFGKFIFLFEIKDAYFPAKAINSLDYEKIKSAIDTKYNTKSKGTGQIVKQLKKLMDKPFEDKSYKELKLKQRNLIIYPIIIYTDNFFSMPGVNRYLNGEFKARLNLEKDLTNTFKKIENLLFMNISFLIEKIHQLPHFDIRELADGYFQYLKRFERKFNKKYDENDMAKMNLPFERYVSNIYPNNKDKYPLKKIFDVLEIEKNIK